MFKNILLAIHGEEVNIKKVINQTLLLAEKNDSVLTVLNVKENNLIYYGEVDTLLPFTAKEKFIDYVGKMTNEQAQMVLDRFEQQAGEIGISFKWKTKEGKPADEIIRELKAENYDLLILGTKEPGPGNTSSKVKERLAKEHLCTVLMVK